MRRRRMSCKKNEQKEKTIKILSEENNKLQDTKKDGGK